MSQARVQQSKFAARKGATLKCERCQREIPKGERYRWFKVGFRSRYKQVRCFRNECTPRPSELESSMLSGALAALESAQDDLAGLRGDPQDDASPIVEAVTGAADGVREVADQYREASEAMGGDYGAGADMAERADTIEQAADELDGYGADDEEPDFEQCENEHHDEDPADDGQEIIERGDKMHCAECETIALDWWDKEIDAAEEALSNAELY